MIELSFPPAFIMILGAILVAMSRPGLRPAFILLSPLVTLYAIWQLEDGVLMTVSFLDYQMELVEASKVRRLFATVFAIMAFAGGLFAFRTAKWYELSAAMAYAAGAIGVCFSGDLLAMFLFWEFMALFSLIVIWSGGTLASRQAGVRYAIMHLFGGVVLKIGIEGIMVHTGSLDIQPLALDSLDTWIVFIGVLINAAAPPVSAWLSDAYPESSPTGGVFLSAFTTKTAILALILLFPGETLLIWIGLYMIFYGIIYALLENDMRRILAYSIVNQVGFMVVGVGIGTEMSINGAAAHAFTDVIFKALMFMSAGSVLYMTGKRKCTELGGLFQSMPLTTICGTIGALSISSFPFTSGFVSKSLISTGAANEGLALVYMLLVAASAGVFLHAGIKFPWYVFFQKDSGLRPTEPPWNMQAAMVFFSVLCIGIGCFPELLYSLLPYDVDYEPYTTEHLVSQYQLLFFAGLAFFIMLPLMKRTLTISLDTDWLWRRMAFGFSNWFIRVLEELQTLSGQLFSRVWNAMLESMERHHGPAGILARTWPTGSMVLWVAILLCAYLILYYI